MLWLRVDSDVDLCRSVASAVSVVFRLCLASCDADMRPDKLCSFFCSVPLSPK